MESEAIEAMKDIEKETAEITARSRENLRRRITAIEADGTEEIRRIARETEEHTSAEIARVKEEYREKSGSVAKDFEKKNLRGKLFHDVLYGKP